MKVEDLDWQKLVKVKNKLKNFYRVRNEGDKAGFYIIAFKKRDVPDGVDALSAAVIVRSESPQDAVAAAAKLHPLSSEFDVGVFKFPDGEYFLDTELNRLLNSKELEPIANAHGIGRSATNELPTFRYKSQISCPHEGCNYSMGAGTLVGGNALADKKTEPENGDMGVCAGCGEFFIFRVENERQWLEVPAPGMLDALGIDHRMVTEKVKQLRREIGRAL